MCGLPKRVSLYVLRKLEYRDLEAHGLIDWKKESACLIHHKDMIVGK